MMTPSPDTAAAIRADLADHPGAALEDVAVRTATSVAEVLACLPAGEAVLAPGAAFEEVMAEIARWGEITLVMNTGDVILEAKGPLPEGRVAQGFFNLQGRPIGGHIRSGACAQVAFVARSLFGMDTRSVQFLDARGGVLFKVYLGRDAARALIPAQMTAFDALRARLAPGVMA
ncbi:heme utilization cystosolic carrier protein HutX [Rhodovulum visakhapatnamense]|uniref:Heme utilization protein HuvX n=1 Tax=Rhodovulum visakhapatnamense TaxID=364297 RepID=A0A4R8G182_9RHOB|nr:heme utilization cystosolic carrier protein HutX [Rhodovulum visakhapatnamense]TDX33275.1 heme utilization protein HuvX [Rhodovulum visakhapatnamense]